MNHSLTAKKKIEITANPKQVWEVITSPDYIKKFLFGAQVQTDWQPKSPITFNGIYNETTYVDKGIIITNQEYQKLEYTYWSQLSGLVDVPDNYSTVTYTLNKIDKQTVLFIWEQKGFANEDAQKHTSQFLKVILEEIKHLSESPIF